MNLKKLSIAISLTLLTGACAVNAANDTKALNNPDFTPVVQAVDLDNNGKMTRWEWQQAGAPISSFNMFEKGRGFVTQNDYDSSPAPQGIDINGDGKLTLSEFKQFDKQMAATMPVTEDKRPRISAAEAALAMWQVQNTMSKHAYYHAAGLNMQEVEALWVDENGAHGKSATFASPAWVMNGISIIKGAYGAHNQDSREKALKALSDINPGVKNISENLGAGHEWAMHTNTTPVIEIAGDGKTAKGIWYSPGMGLMTNIENGKVGVRGTFFWEKYGGDFVLEDGQWKIWHLQMAYDFTPSLDDKWLDFDKVGMAEAGERDGEMPPGFSKPEYSYPAYSPERPSIIYPKFPEPYYTFDDTFSY